MYGGITIRPSQALCLVCSLGKNPAEPSADDLKKILEMVEKNPDIPVTLRCKAGDVFSFQDVIETRVAFMKERWTLIYCKNLTCHLASH